LLTLHYPTINLNLLVQNTAEQSSDEEEELQQLQTIEQKLMAHDPTFTIEDTHAYISTKRSALISAFKPVYDEGDPAGMENAHRGLSFEC
jgi:actin-related protein 5